MLVVVVEYLEAVVAAVTEAVKPRHQLCQLRAVHALTGKYSKGAGGINALLDGPDLLPHEIGQLNQKNLLRVKRVDFIERSLGGENVKRIEAKSQIGRISAANDVPGVREFVDMPAPG